jgi:hypothetical protein
LRRAKIMNLVPSRRIPVLLAVLALGLGLALWGCGTKKQESHARGPRVERAVSKASAAGDSNSTPGAHEGSASKNGSGKVVDVTDSTFKSEVLKSKMPVLVDLWTET